MIAKLKNFLNSYFKTLKSLMFVLTKPKKINLDYRKNTNISEEYSKPDIWYFNSSSHLDYLSLYQLAGIETIKILKEHGYTCISLLCAGGPGYCQVGSSSKNPFAPPPCLSCYSFNSELYDSQTIKFKKKNDFMEFEIEKKILENIIEPSLVWLLRDSNNKTTRAMLKQQLILASKNWLSFLNSIEKSMLPKLIILFNGISFPESIIKYFMKENNVKIITFESAILENSIIFSNKSAPKLDFNFKKEHLLNENEKNLINQYLTKRIKGDFKRGSIDYWNEIKELNVKETKKINQFNKVVTVFLNVPFDTSQIGISSIFSNMYEWIDEVIEFAKSNTNICFIFRSHPDEIRKDKKISQKTSDYINKKTKNVNNVLIVPGKSQLSSYELIDISDLTLVFNSTIAIESFLLKTNVLTAAEAHYSQLPQFEFPNSKEEYFKKISYLLVNNNFVGENDYEIVLSYFYQMVFESSVDFSCIAEKNNKKKYAFYRNPNPEKQEYNLLEKNILNKFKKVEF